MSKTKLAALPTSKAKTAYELLSDVCRIILDEPKRYDQGMYIGRVNTNGEAIFIDPHRAPACGTVGCIAGWVATLKRGNRFSYDQTRVIARETLGLNREQAGELFNELFVNHLGQTPAHAKSGVAHIRRFQKKYAKQLRTTVVQ